MNYLDKPKLAKLTNEIHFFNEQGIKVSIEVGKRLDDAKSEFSNSDDWMDWALDEFGYKKSQAYKLVAIAKRFQSTGIEIDGGIEKMYALTAFDDDEIKEPVQLPSGETKAPLEMSNKELEQYKRAAAEAERRTAAAEASIATAQSTAQHWEAKWRQEASKPAQVQTVVPEHMKREIESLKQQLASSRDLQKMYEKDSKEYEELKQQIGFLNREKGDLHRQIESATSLSSLAIEIDSFLKTKLAPIKYSRVWERMDSPVAVQNFTDILGNVRAWLEDMERYVPKNNRKVIDYDPAS